MNLSYCPFQGMNQILTFHEINFAFLLQVGILTRLKSTKTILKHFPFDCVENGVLFHESYSVFERCSQLICYKFKWRSIFFITFAISKLKSNLLCIVAKILFNKINNDRCNNSSHKTSSQISCSCAMNVK